MRSPETSHDALTLISDWWALQITQWTLRNFPAAYGISWSRRYAYVRVSQLLASFTTPTPRHVRVEEGAFRQPETFWLESHGQVRACSGGQAAHVRLWPMPLASFSRLKRIDVCRQRCADSAFLEAAAQKSPPPDADRPLHASCKAVESTDHPVAVLLLRWLLSSLISESETYHAEHAEIYLNVTIICEYKILRFWGSHDFAGINFCDFTKSS